MNEEVNFKLKLEEILNEFKADAKKQIKDDLSVNGTVKSKNENTAIMFSNIDGYILSKILFQIAESIGHENDYSVSIKVNKIN